MQMKKHVLLLFGMIWVAGCAMTESARTGPEAASARAGFLAGYYENLQPGPEGGVKLRWLKPGVDFSRYNQVMLDSVVFFLAEESEYKGMDPQELKELADGFNLQLANTLKARLPIVADPGPNVVRIRFAVTDLKQSRPVVSGVSSVLPVGLGVSILKKGVTGAWSGSGATGAEMMALDSLSNEVIAAAKDERSAGFTERFSKWGSADEAFKFWAERLALFLDNARSKKNPG
jgi:hypothetical protein